MFRTPDDILGSLIELLKGYDVNPQIQVDRRSAERIKFGSLMLSSLEVLQLAMDLEDELKIDVEVRNLPPDHTLSEIAHSLSKITSR
jgi:acyl carrier protein